MIKYVFTAVICLILYTILIVPFTDHLADKPVVEKLGYIPSITALKIVSADHKELAAASLVLKVLMYFGGLFENTENRLKTPPDYQAMSRILHGAVKLDPYNMDAYYFAQGFLTWDVKQYKLANDLLDYGMRYRTWDWYLPFFAGFNSAYFMKDYKKAAEYYKRSGELSGSDLSKLLAGRYMQESGQTDLAIAYLSTMEKGERNSAVKRNYSVRLAAFKGLRRIELARDSYLQKKGTLPKTIEQMVREGFLSSVPVDPYGGRFYLEPDGKVATTSKFAFPNESKEKKDKMGEKAR
jgi:tetratricopeptide (TPR) repeat protein